MTSDTNALQLAQEFLDRQGAATLAGDIEETLAYCGIPCTLESVQGRVVATTKEQMRGVCAQFIDELAKRQVIEMSRQCLEAVFKGDDTIWATYETRYLHKGNIIEEDPYVVFTILKFREGRWKFSSVQFAVSDESPANVTLRGQQFLAECGSQD